MEGFGSRVWRRVQKITQVAKEKERKEQQRQQLQREAQLEARRRKAAEAERLQREREEAEQRDLSAYRAFANDLQIPSMLQNVRDFWEVGEITEDYSPSEYSSRTSYTLALKFSFVMPKYTPGHWYRKSWKYSGGPNSEEPLEGVSSRRYWQRATYCEELWTMELQVKLGSYHIENVSYLSVFTRGFPWITNRRDDWLYLELPAEGMRERLEECLVGIVADMTEQNALPLQLKKKYGPKIKNWLQRLWAGY